MVVGGASNCDEKGSAMVDDTANREGGTAVVGGSAKCQERRHSQGTTTTRVFEWGWRCGAMNKSEEWRVKQGRGCGAMENGEAREKEAMPGLSKVAFSKRQRRRQRGKEKEAQCRESNGWVEEK